MQWVHKTYYRRITRNSNQTHVCIVMNNSTHWWKSDTKSEITSANLGTVNTYMLSECRCVDASTWLVAHSVYAYKMFMLIARDEVSVHLKGNSRSSMTHMKRSGQTLIVSGEVDTCLKGNLRTSMKHRFDKGCVSCNYSVTSKRYTKKYLWRKYDAANIWSSRGITNGLQSMLAATRPRFSSGL